MPRVLVVEDSPTQARLLTCVLQGAGMEVVTVPDADRGFRQLTSAPFDLVLSDLHLPGDSGFDLCRRIKADARLRHVAVVVHTGQTDPANVLRGLEAGADGFMTKDRAPKEIVRSVRQALDRRNPVPSDGNGRTHVAFLNQEFAIA